VVYKITEQEPLKLPGSPGNESKVEDVQPLFHADDVLYGKDLTKDGGVSPYEERPLVGQAEEIVFGEEIEKVLEEGPGDDIHFIELELDDVYGAAPDGILPSLEHRHLVTLSVHLQEMDPVYAVFTDEPVKGYYPDAVGKRLSMVDLFYDPPVDRGVL